MRMDLSDALQNDFKELAGYATVRSTSFRIPVFLFKQRCER